MKRAIVVPLAAGALLGAVASPAAAQTLTPTSANFPPTPFRTDSAPIPFTYTNNTAGFVDGASGTSNTYTSGTFKVGSSTCPSLVPAGASCTVNVVFAPYTITPAAKSGTLFVGTQTAALTGTGYLPKAGGKKCKKGKKGAAAAKKKKCKKGKK